MHIIYGGYALCLAPGVCVCILYAIGNWPFCPTPSIPPMYELTDILSGCTVLRSLLEGVIILLSFEYYIVYLHTQNGNPAGLL